MINIKKYNEKILHCKFFFVLVFLFILPACIKNANVSGSLGSAVTGSQGLVVGFYGNTRTITSDKFELKLLVQNAGSYPSISDAKPAPEGTIRIVGHDTSIIKFDNMEGAQQIDTLPLMGKTQNSNGGQTIIPFPGTITYSNIPKGQIYSPTLQAIACYKYQTSLQAQVCIDPNPDAEGAKACSPSEKKFSTGQGAPVSITSITMEPSKQRTRFGITLQKTGSANDVVIRSADDSGFEECKNGDEISSKNKDTVSLQAVLINKQQLDCKPLLGTNPKGKSGEISLIGAKGYIECEFPINGQKTAYSTPIQIIINYGYKTTAKTTIYIKNDADAEVP